MYYCVLTSVEIELGQLGHVFLSLSFSFEMLM